MKNLIGLLILLVMATGAAADPLKDTFGNGVLGVAWGAKLTEVVGLFPNGDHVYAVTPGCRAYWVKDGLTVLGVPRERNGALFGFDENNRVAVVAIAFPFERKDELRTTLTMLLGQRIVHEEGNTASYGGWPSRDGWQAQVTEFGDADQRIIWLTIALPGYKSQKEAC